jgi:hypothetical protein
MSKNITEDIEHVNHRLEFDEDIDLQVKGWKIQRAAWIIIFALLLLAALGLFGTGVLSYRTISKKGDVIDYEHFGRFQAQTQIELTINNKNGTAQIAFPQTYIDNFEIERITPQPEKTEILNSTVVYTFNITDKGKIVIYMMPQTTGTIKGTVAVNNTVFNLSQFIYP